MQRITIAGAGGLASIGAMEARDQDSDLSS